MSPSAAQYQPLFVRLAETRSLLSLVLVIGGDAGVVFTTDFAPPSGLQHGLSAKLLDAQ